MYHEDAYIKMNHPLKLLLFSVRALLERDGHYHVVKRESIK
jgi:hypothetical protein